MNRDAAKREVLALGGSLQARAYARELHAIAARTGAPEHLREAQELDATIALADHGIAPEVPQEPEQVDLWSA